MALQERYSQAVLAKLRSTSIFANIVGRQFEGDPKAGAVKVPVRAEATVAAYDPATGLAGTNTATTFQTIAIDKDYAVNEIVDGYEAAALPDGKVIERLESAGYDLGNQAANDILAAINASKTAATTKKTAVLGQILDTIAQAQAAGVDNDKIWVVVNPANYASLLQETLFVAGNNEADMQTGRIGALAGTPVYVCNNANFTDSFIVGNSDFIHFVCDYKVEPTVRDGVGTYIGSAQVVARMVYGAAVTDSTTVFYK